MKTAEIQKGPIQNQSTAIQKSGGLSVRPPQNAFATQLAAMEQSDLQSPMQKKLISGNTTSPNTVDLTTVPTLAERSRSQPHASTPLSERLRTTVLTTSPAMTAQRKMIESINNSPRMTAQRQRLESLAGTAQRVEEEEPLQGKFRTDQEENEELLQGKFASESPAQLEQASSPKPNASTQLSTNNTGLPDNLKSGIENLSGMSMDNVKVHYNSSQPAQLNALAYAQGSDIHIAPGQEQHLPHEAWHVVQQAQGRVKPTMQMKAGVLINDDQNLEAEADVMGAKAVGVRAVPLVIQENVEISERITPAAGTVQRLVAIASNKIEQEKNKKAIDSKTFDSALVSGGWEAQKFTGGPIKLLLDITQAEIEDKSELSIVGHGAGKGTTGDISIPDVVNHLATNGFGKKKNPFDVNAVREANMVLFSCLSGSKLFNAGSSDAQIYKAKLREKNIDATILAPKGIAITDMDVDLMTNKVTSIKQELTAAYSANSLYSKIQSYWINVSKADTVNKKKNFKEILDLYSGNTKNVTEKEFNISKKRLRTYLYPTQKGDVAYGQQLKNKFDLDTEQKAQTLPKSLLALIQGTPKNDLQKKILDDVCLHYKSEKDNFRLTNVGTYSLSQDPLPDMERELSELKCNYGIVGGVVDNQTGNAIPGNIQTYIKKLSNKDNWVLI